MNIYDTANKLATEIKESTEYNKFKNMRTQIQGNLELNKKIEEFEKARQEMQILSIRGAQNLDEKSKEIQDIYAELMKNEIAKKYFDSELKFSVLIADVNKIIGEAIKDVLIK